MLRKIAMKKLSEHGQSRQADISKKMHRRSTDRGREHKRHTENKKKIESRAINTSVHVLKFEKKRDRNSFFFVIRNFWQNIPFGFAENIIPKKRS